jgi:hypothetical protein
MLGPNIPLVGWSEYALGGLAIMGGIVIAATED